MKANQKALYAWAKSFNWKTVPTNATTDIGHGRRVTRGDKALQLNAADTDFPGARQIDQIRQTRATSMKAGQRSKQRKRSVELVYLLCSSPHTDAPIQSLAAWVQSHWHIENQLHWAVTSPSMRIAPRPELVPVRG